MPLFYENLNSILPTFRLQLFTTFVINLYLNKYCTYSNGRFFSARKDKGPYPYHSQVTTKSSLPDPLTNLLLWCFRKPSCRLFHLALHVFSVGNNGQNK